MGSGAVLVTGSHGFVGRRVVERLNDAGRRVIELPEWPDGDLTRRETLAALPPVEAVVHLAAKSFIPATLDDPAATYFNNVVATLNVVDYCRRARVGHLVHVSSYVYGQPLTPAVSEQHPLNIRLPYGRSKLMAEQLVRAYHEDYGVAATVLRPFNIYGPGQDPRMLVPTVVNQVASDSADVRVQTLEPRRDFVYVDDVADAVVKALDRTPAAFDVFNIGAGRSTSVAELIDAAFRVSGRRKRVVASGETRPHEVLDTVADIGHARAVLGWAPRWTLDNGLGEMFRALGVSVV